MTEIELLTSIEEHGTGIFYLLMFTNLLLSMLLGLMIVKK